MQDLPDYIAEKLNRLPVMPFDGSDDFIGIILSDDFTDIFNYYKEHYLPESMKSQSEIQQKTSLYLTLTNQDEDILNQTNAVLYRRPVPDIHTFLTDKFYMGMNNVSLYKYWQERLEEMFRQGSPVRKAIFSGCIGAGKSTVARKAFLYVLYRMLCLRYPRAVLGVDADAKLAAIMISMTLDQAFHTNLGPLMELMKTMPCFQQVRSVRSFENFDLSNPRCPIPWQFEKSSMTIYFPDAIVVKCGSTSAHFTGFNVFNSFCLVGATKIHTTNGNIEIKDIANKFNTTEKIFTYDLDGNEIEIINVKQTALVQNTIKIWFDDENFIECTPNHKFLIKNPKEKDFYITYIHDLPFKEAQYLTEEDEIEEYECVSNKK